MSELSTALQELIKKWGFVRVLRTLARLSDEAADDAADGQRAALVSVGGRLRGAAQLLQGSNTEAPVGE